MVVVERAVRFEEVDAAGILFFAHFASYAHEAMERLFDEIEGGYVTLITKRRIGFPAVRLDSEFSAPLRYGDTARIEAEVTRLGNRSCTFTYRFLRMRDDVLAATLHHTVVVTDLERMQSTDMPADVRACLRKQQPPPE